jgi:hypothetical protein
VTALVSLAKMHDLKVLLHVCPVQYNSAEGTLLGVSAKMAINMGVETSLLLERLLTMGALVGPLRTVHCCHVRIKIALGGKAFLTLSTSEFSGFVLDVDEFRVTVEVPFILKASPTYLTFVTLALLLCRVFMRSRVQNEAASSIEYFCAGEALVWTLTGALRFCHYYGRRYL